MCQRGWSTVSLLENEYRHMAKLDNLGRSFTPFGLSLILVVLSVLPTQIPGYMQIAPILVLISVYHWTIYRPNLLPIFAVFILGLLQDLLLGTPVGLYVLVFLNGVWRSALSTSLFCREVFYTLLVWFCGHFNAGVN